MNKPTCGEANLIRFNKVDYNSVSHAFNQAVVASYGHIQRYGFEETDDYILIPQSRRNLVLLKKKCSFSSTNRSLILSEGRIENASKVKEVCYDLRRILESPSAEVRRGIRFHERKGVCIDDYNDGPSLDLIYHSWKATKEGDGKTFRIAFNPARYRRSYELKNLGYNIYQKVVFIREHPYALINFALHEEHAYELSFL